MPDEQAEYEAVRPQVLEAKRQLLGRFARDSNVLGAGFGRRTQGTEVLDVPACVVYVARKVRRSWLPQSATIPESIEVNGGRVEIDVVETGPFYASSYLLREDRPVPSGVSIGRQPDTSGAGTLGCLVRDNIDGSHCILSNNHVLANSNDATRGDLCLQPAGSDGGTGFGDVIGYLARWINIDFNGSNNVDCAIANAADGTTENRMKGEEMGPPSPTQAAVGLLFAQSCARTTLCDINAVVSQLNVEMLGGSLARSNAIIGGAVQKVGRTTQYTTGRIRETNASVTVAGYNGKSAAFDGVIMTSSMGAGGDSGSVVCYGGSGEATDVPCDADFGSTCAATLAAENLVGVPLTQDLPEIRMGRDRYLAKTRVGSWAIRLYETNEARITERIRRTALSEDERELARALYSRYSGDAKLALADPDRRDLRITEQHLEDARVTLQVARSYLTVDEYVAAEQLLDAARPAVGKNAREILHMLDDDVLLARVRAIVAPVRTLDTDVAID